MWVNDILITFGWALSLLLASGSNHLYTTWKRGKGNA